MTAPAPFHVAFAQCPRVRSKVSPDLPASQQRLTGYLAMARHMPQPLGTRHDCGLDFFFCHAFFSNKKATPWVALILDFGVTKSAGLVGT
jgi:hypothetical protein